MTDKFTGQKTAQQTGKKENAVIFAVLWPYEKTTKTLSLPEIRNKGEENSGFVI